MDNYRIDLKKNRIELLDNRFYELDGEFYPSVTTILDAYPKGPAFYEWLKQVGEKADEIRDSFGKRGSAVHNLTEAYDNGLPVSLMLDGSPQYTSIEWAMFERYIDFSTRFSPEIMAIEMNYASKELGYGGTLDRVIRLNGKVYLIDIKTSNYMHAHFFLQLSAYERLFAQYNPETKIDGLAILHLNARTRTEGKGGAIQGIGWQLVFPEKSIFELRALFDATHKLWLTEFGSLKPRNISYTIQHQKDGNKKKQG